jgi:hypothetical protein
MQNPGERAMRASFLLLKFRISYREAVRCNAFGVVSRDQSSVKMRNFETVQPVQFNPVS